MTAPQIVKQLTLWDDHYIYTREFVLTTVLKAPHAGDVAKRLFKNQKELGANLGALLKNTSAGTEYHKLLKEHIAIAAEFVGAAIKGKAASVEDAKKAWIANGTELGKFLYRVLPKKSGSPTQTQWIAHMKTHLTTTLAEAVALIQGKDGIAQGDKAYAHVRMMARAIAASFG